MKNTDSAKANKSGQKLEKMVRDFLTKNGLSYKEGGSKTIDFKINTDQGTLYVDCTNQNTGGSVDEKVPHKVWKYHQKYKFESIIIIRGEQDLKESVHEHLKYLKIKESVTTYVYTFEQFCNKLNGKPINSTLEKFI